MQRNDATRLRLLAAEALAAANQMTDADCRRGMMGLAASYERLADHAEGRESDSSKACASPECADCGMASERARRHAH